METGGGASPREQMLKQLAAGHDTFMELIGNLSEGTKVGDACGRGLSRCAVLCGHVCVQALCVGDVMCGVV